MNRIKCFILILSFLTLTAVPNDAYALSTDLKNVMTTSGYGAAAGTAVGLAAFPFTGTWKGVFMGASVGLVLGAIVGIYHITHRDDPQNPLRASVSDHQENPLGGTVIGRMSLNDMSPPLIDYSVSVLTF